MGEENLEKHRDPIRDKCFEEREELRARVAQLEEALKFYADPENHTYRMIDLQNPIVLDGGKKARAALFPNRYLQEEE